MIIKETKTWKLSELPEDVKEKAISKLFDINVCFDWWENTYEDAKTVLLEITEFDIGRASYCKGDFIESAEDTAEKIMTEHGGSCDTYQTAKSYSHDRSALIKKYSDGKNTDFITEDNEYDFDNDCNELDEEFLRSILEDYRIILSKEFDYSTSEEAIIATIEANEYDFDVNGNIF